MRTPIKIIIISIILISLLSSGCVNNKTTSEDEPIGITWGEPRSILVNDEINSIFDIESIKISDLDYLFYIASNKHDNLSLFYITKRNGVWSDPSKLDFPYKTGISFDCVYDNTKNEFHFFIELRNESGSAIYWSKGNLSKLSAPIRLIAFPDSDYEWPYCPSAVLVPGEKIYLFYQWITGISENLNCLYLMMYEQNIWSSPEKIGIGNSPNAIIDENGRLYMYSNLYTYTKGVQYSVDEWNNENGEWKKEPIITSAMDSNSDPIVLAREDSTLLLFYDNDNGDEGSPYRLLVQSKQVGNRWTNYEIVPCGKLLKRIEHITAVIDGNIINLYYIIKDEIKSIDGQIKK